ncbi:hypothetical protein Lal_00029242 [Lupinus albus]|uniref:Putative organ specific protein n=1 Tax=Lupinus albus TaxID=3870 RepID=A0A6A5NPZ8_LUPAL|nr:putative organ specific protein [Lupinus albus]KAF1885353.1 hypothetical protein Lal_00029242 [Lupinus albus]
MKSIFALFLVFSLLLVANLSYAIKHEGEYWKNIMKDQPMPETIKDLLVQDPQVLDSGKDHFIRDFDIRPNVILYHTHVVSKKQKQHPFVNNFEPEFQE